LILDVLEVQRHEDTCGRIGAGPSVRDDVVNLSAGDSTSDQRPSSGSTEPVTTELRSDFVADLNSPPQRRSSEATRADKLPVRVIDEELHRPRTVSVRRILQMLQSEADGLGELRPAVRDGRADQLAEQGVVVV